MKRGFTLLELIVVVIILAILAGIFFPRLIKMAEKARQTEALGQLGSIRASQIRYFVQEGNYTDDWGRLDIDRPQPASDIAPVRYFTYDIANDVAALGTAHRRCNPGSVDGRPASNPADYGYDMIINDNGTVTTNPADLGPGDCSGVDL